MKNSAMVYKISFFNILVSTMICIGQQPVDTINNTDAKGLKQGYWEKKYPNGKTAYKGYFKDDNPVGKMVRYYETGNIKAVMNFSDNGKFAQTKLYYQNDSLAAEGFYKNGKKDSTWNYYSYYDNIKKSTENYKNGVKHGISQVYFNNGNIFDETNWVNGVKHGEWIQYFQSGEMQMVTYYEKGVLHGCFNVFFENGDPEIVGRHENNVRHGTWMFYDKKGQELLQLEYNMGNLLNEEALNKKDQEYFEEMDKNIGKIKEPTIEDFVGN